MVELTIRATTTNEAIEDAIPFLDMRSHAIEMRDMAAAVIEEQGDQNVLELHEFGDIVVLYSPDFGYAYVNERSVGVGNSLVVENDHTLEECVKHWTGLSYRVVFKDNAGCRAVESIAASAEGSWSGAVERFDGEHDLAFVKIPYEQRESLEAILDEDDNVVSYSERT